MTKMDEPADWIAPQKVKEKDAPESEASREFTRWLRRLRKWSSAYERERAESKWPSWVTDEEPPASHE